MSPTARYVYLINVILLWLLIIPSCTGPDRNKQWPLEVTYVTPPIGELAKPLRYEISDSAILRFALDEIPAVIGWDATPGMLDTFYVYWEDGQLEVMFPAIIYNSSFTKTFYVDTSDSNDDVPNIFRAELLTMGGKVLQTAEKTSFCICETRPVRDGYPMADEFHTLAPQWADVYKANTPGQSFTLTNVKPGKYQVRYTLDPLNLYGQHQVVTFTVNWDGTTFRAIRNR